MIFEYIIVTFDDERKFFAFSKDHNYFESIGNYLSKHFL
jgi:hypothetical protein